MDANVKSKRSSRRGAETRRRKKVNAEKLKS
jgi:hypothetical protein